MNLIALTCLLGAVVLPLCCGQQMQQYFTEVPSNTSVREGQMAVLRCRVGNRQGRVQWAKDGFALGFERTLPSFARYTIMGSDELGEHHMKIENATLEDDAVYSCQVGPAAGTKPIRAEAKLTVLMPPTEVEIVDHVQGGRVKGREGEEIVIQCAVRNAKPAAEIVWYKRNVEFKSGLVENSSKDSEMAQRFDTFSKLTITARPDDHEAEYTCEARHPALSSPKRAGVLLNVVYPPGPPEIIGYSDGDTVLMGQDVRLECVSRGGNPLATVVWYKNEVKVDNSFATSGRESRNVHSFRAEASDNNARFRCEVSNELTVAPMRAEVTLVVRFVPESVTIKGPSEAKVNETVSFECSTSNSNPEARIVWNLDSREVRENGSRITTSPNGGWVTASNLTTTVRNTGRNLTVTCHAVVAELAKTVTQMKTVIVAYPPQPPVISGFRDQVIRENSHYRLGCMSIGGNPPAALKWYYAGSRKEIKSAYSTFGSVASADVELLARREDNGKELRCEASNSALDAPLVDSTVIKIEFQPQNVSVRVRPEKLRPGVTATLSCDTSSSNPESRVTWIRGKSGHVIPATANKSEKGQHLGVVTKSELQLAITPDLHGVEITCQASNGIGSTINNVLTLEVLYKPEFVHPPEHTINVIEGEPAAINLTARANPSAIAYKWSRDGSGIRSSTESGLGERVTSSGSLLNITRVQREDNGEYRCEAENSEGKTVTTIRLNVQYPATIVHIKQVVMVEEGSDAVLECKASGNPLAASTVSWRREGFDMQGRTVLSSTQNGTAYLTVKDIARNDTGAFECVASNGIGAESVEKTWLVVKYKPVMDDAPQLSKAAGDEGETARLVCRAHGAPNITFRWSREGNLIPPSTPKYSLNTRQLDLMTWESTLDINLVVSKDYGLYDCVALNEMGTNVMKVALSGTSRPDTPVALHVMNTTHDAVQLAWIPGFDGGIAQGFRIRYSQVGSELVKYADVYPRNVTSFTLGGLALGTEYAFSVMALNDRGESNYTQDIVKARTSNEAPPTAQKPRDLESRAGDMPKVLIIVITIVGTSLLVLNVALIACFVRRKHRKRLAKGAESANEEPTDSPSLARADWTTIIIAVSTVGFVLLLIVNIVIVSCLCVRRRKKRIEEAMSSEGGSSKSATIEMYAPSSYNETVNGETLSSISEKSEAYSQNGSHSDYAAEDASKAAVSTYLIDQPDGQVAYGSYRVASASAANNPGQVSAHGTLSRPPKTVNFDMGEDNYIDTLRRNAYAQGNDTMYGKPRMATPLSQHADSYYGVNASSPINYPPAPPPGFHSNVNHRFNPLNDPVSSQLGTHSPYTPMGTLNIPAASGIYGPSVSGRVSAGLPVNLPLPLPMSMQAHGTQFSSFNANDAPSPVMETATAQFSGPSLATVRSLETEGHLV